MNAAARSNLIALARNRKGNARSRMLRMIMPYLSRENGDRLSKAIDNKSPGEFKAVWETIKKEIAAKLEKQKAEACGCEGQEVAESEKPVTVEQAQETTEEVFKAFFGSLFNEIERRHNDSYMPAAVPLSVQPSLNTSLSASRAETDLLKGSGTERDELRELIAVGFIEIGEGKLYRIGRIETISRRHRASSPLDYKIITDILDTESDTVVKSFSATGHFVKTIYDGLLIAKAYLESVSA